MKVFNKRLVLLLLTLEGKGRPAGEVTCERCGRLALAAVTHQGLIGQAARGLLQEKMKANTGRKGSQPGAWPGAGAERMLFGSKAP